MIRKKIDELLNRFGYYHTGLSKKLRVTEKDVEELFQSYKDNDVMNGLLLDLCRRDKELYFQASEEADRQKIRGAFMRTNYFISLIKKADGKRKKI